ncbi:MULTISPECIES: MlaE family ABC transporter permease [unclassified Gordonia (in: high G+C Gram-positive bacteria)]|uniref:MlaE family ABC transporter permease n=1 Tax=unclassified Gordonia (in: high G+C Gram-positive bacteria) TaxID=2657482 RepID=UPI001FFE4BB3|nr:MULTISPECIES: ABC transporter permease [unclassified Gordonia (in: high G+C Gram-positive bacteria)]UQE74540.1 ABC transporter permease [Gordonia sp. PP30]
MTRGVTIAKSRPEYLAYEAKKIAGKPLKLLDGAGEQMSFYARTMAWIPKTLVHYQREVLRILAEVAFGSGGLAVIAGTVGVMVLMSGFTGVVVGMQGYAALSQIGAEALSGFLSAYVNTREVAPLVAGLALSATVGCGFTAQLGAMRISEEIDALEVMAVPSVPFLVSTRVIAGFVAVIPLYVLGLMAAYLASRFINTVFNGQSSGSYDHYFNLFLPPVDVLWSFLKVLIFAFVIILVHCYYGYFASGGPAGVGVAVGHAVRAALVLIAVLDFFLSLAIWGTSTSIRVGG